jgi:hypothetical protein
MKATLRIALLCGVAGCGTTRVTDTSRTASEMLLVSQAVDEAVAKFDFSPLAGKPVFLDTQYLDGVVDRGYVVSTLRQHLLAHGALLLEDRAKAQYVVEARSGGVGTDRHSLLFGVPQMTVPALVPGQPTQIPEIALVKKTDQKGLAKLAVFAYHRPTGRAVWQSGAVESVSTLKDTWVFGAGPFSKGSVHQETLLAGEPLPKVPIPFLPGAEPEETAPVRRPTVARLFKQFEPPTPAAVAGLTGPAVFAEPPYSPGDLPIPTGPGDVVPAGGPKR